MDDITAAFEDTTEHTIRPPKLVAKPDTFTADVVTYFEAYVRAGLSKGLLPQKRFAGQYKEGLFQYVRTNAYPQLNKNLYKNFVTGLPQKTFAVTQNKYTAHSDDHTLALFGAVIESAEQIILHSCIQSIVHYAATERLHAVNAPSMVLTDRVLVQLPHIIQNEFVVPLLTQLQKKLEHSNDLQKWLQTIETDVTDKLYDAICEPISQILQVFFAEGDTTESLFETCKEHLPLSHVQVILQEYIDDLRISDAYQHMYALHRAAQVAPNTALQLYFATISINGNAFPLFYTPLTSKHTYPTLTIEFENRIFINNEALAFVAQQYSAHTGVAVTVPVFEAIHYTDQSATAKELQHIIDTVLSVLVIKQPLLLSQPNEQTATNTIITLTNAVTVAAAEINTTAIAQEYRSIIDNPKTHNTMSGYIRSLVTEPKPRFVEEITESWQAKSAIEKLLPVNALATNDEQKQVLHALDRDDCEIVVVKGAQGTGKSHLALSASLQALGKKQTVLVVSDTSLAASEVSNGVAQTLTNGTASAAAYSPVLDLSHPELLDYFDEQSIDSIGKQNALLESKSSELSAAKKRKIQDATEILTSLTQSAENINLHEVEQTVFNERRFAGKTWIDDEPIDLISADLQKLHRAIQYVRASEASYLLPYVEESQQRAIDSFIRIFKEYEKANKNVSTRLPEFIVRYRKLLPEQRENLQADLAYIQSNYRQFIKILKSHTASTWLAVTDNTTFDQLDHQETILQKLLAIAHNVKKLLRNTNETAIVLDQLVSYTVEPAEITSALNTYIEQVATLKSKLFGFSGRTLVVENLNKQLLKSLPQYSLPEPEKQADMLALMSNIVQQISEQLAISGLSLHYWKEVIHVLRTDAPTIAEISEIVTSLNSPAQYEFMAEFHVYEADNLLANIALLHNATDLNKVFKENANFAKLFGITAIGHLLSRPQDFSSKINKLSGDLHEASQLDESKQIIKQFIKKYPAASSRIGISVAGGNLEVIEDTFANSDSEYIKEYLSHKKKEQDIRSYFDEVTVDAFNKTIRELEQICGIELQQAVNKQFLQYVAQNLNSFTAIKDRLQSNRALDSKLFKNMLKGFSCVVGTINQVSTSLPLLSESFDLVIVENASRISIAQLFPISLRARKILLLGDDAQLYKPAIADTSLNNIYASAISTSLRTLLEGVPADSKNAIIAKTERTMSASVSALSFYSEYANYEQTLHRQYGVYGELSAFSAKYYYNNTLQVLTSRAKVLPDVIMFSKTKPTQSDVSLYTNDAEVRYIIDELTKLKDKNYTGTIGIITPYARQAALLQKELDECVINDWFERRQLVVMTFDDTKHAARDYMFYSFVASTQFDTLLQKFPSVSAIKTSDSDVRSERLLAGFTKATQTVHFVLSKDIQTYTSAISQALQFYQAKLQGANIPVKGTTTDILLPTEANITQAYARTKFAKKYADKAQFVPKYPFADYLRILSPEYQKPTYKMYFLLKYTEQSIVIEYDDFKERFLQTENGTKDSGAVYLTAQDIYGEKLLESYGYKFLRLNKFNIGSDPSKTLDIHLAELIKNPAWPADNGFNL